MSITKTLTETYTLRGSKCLWAKINLDIGEQSVNVMISSDYGEFNHYWGSTGHSPKEFLCRIDIHYCMQKLMGATSNMYEPDFEARHIAINELIIEARLDSTISKDQAREAWQEAIDIFERCGNSNDIYFSMCTESEELECIFYDWDSIPENTKLKPVVEQFWTDVWVPFADELKKEIHE